MNVTRSGSTQFPARHSDVQMPRSCQARFVDFVGCISSGNIQMVFCRVYDLQYSSGFVGCVCVCFSSAVISAPFSMCHLVRFDKLVSGVSLWWPTQVSFAGVVPIEGLGQPLGREGNIFCLAHTFPCEHTRLQGYKMIQDFRRESR